MLINQAHQKVLFKNPNGIKTEATLLNVGCGPYGIKNAQWYNIDVRKIDGVDFTCDAGRSLPFPEKRFKAIFSEHFFEHLPEADAKIFLFECLRILVPGGLLRLSVPDGGLYLEKYCQDRDWLLARWPGKFHTPMGVVNRIFRQGSEHQYCYDFETLSLWLEDAGFVDVEHVEFRKGSCPDLLIDREVRRSESLYVEAKRSLIQAK